MIKEDQKMVNFVNIVNYLLKEKLVIVLNVIIVSVIMIIIVVLLEDVLQELMLLYSIFL